MLTIVSPENLDLVAIDESQIDQLHVFTDNPRKQHFLFSEVDSITWIEDREEICISGVCDWVYATVNFPVAHSSFDVLVKDENASVYNDDDVKDRVSQVSDFIDDLADNEDIAKVAAETFNVDLENVSNLLRNAFNALRGDGPISTTAPSADVDDENINDEAVNDNETVDNDKTQNETETKDEDVQDETPDQPEEPQVVLELHRNDAGKLMSGNNVVGPKRMVEVNNRLRELNGHPVTVNYTDVPDIGDITVEGTINARKKDVIVTGAQSQSASITEGDGTVCKEVVSLSVFSR